MNYAISANKAGHCYATVATTFAAMRLKVLELQNTGYGGIGIRFVPVAA